MRHYILLFFLFYYQGLKILVSEGVKKKHGKVKVTCVLEVSVGKKKSYNLTLSLRRCAHPPKL